MATGWRPARSVGLLLALLALFLAAAAPIASASSLGSGPRRARPVAPTALAATVITFTYCAPGGHGQAMTVFRRRGERGLAPVVLQVHGGGWERGQRFTSLTQSPTLEGLVRSGIAVASIDYRLAPRYRWPAQIDDVLCALRSLRAHARLLGINARRVGAWGSSAGGQLVSLAATAGTQADWDRGAFPHQPVTLEAVADEFGPADLASSDWGAYVRRIAVGVFGAPAGQRSATLVDASPTDRVAKGDPPFLILQGTADQIVPPLQSVNLARRLGADGDHVNLVLVQGGGHGLGTPSEKPSPGQLDVDIVSFFVHALASSTISR